MLVRFICPGIALKLELIASFCRLQTDFTGRSAAGKVCITLAP